MRARNPKCLKKYMWILFCLFLSALAYRGVLTADFIGFDDNLHVSQNRFVQQGLSREGMRWAWTAIHASTWQPLVWISYMLDTSLQGFAPESFHRTNLLLHFINIILVFWLTRKICHNPVAASIATMLFAIHPVHVESVAWIAERKGLLSMTFGCLSLLAYLQYATSGKQRYFVVAGITLALGLMAKPMLIILPLLFLLLDIWPARRLQAASDLPKVGMPLVTEKMPFFILSIGSSIITSYAQFRGGSFLGLGTISVWARIANAGISVWRYIWHLIFPVRLAILYPHPVQWPFWISLPALLALVGGGYLLFTYRRKVPFWTWGTVWFILSLLPVLGFNQFGWHAMADRFLYLPAIGLYLAIGIACANIFEQHRYKLMLAGSIVCIVLFGLTQWQTRFWQNSIVLFERAVAVTRQNWVMHNSLGTALSHAGHLTEASYHFAYALELNPENPKAWFNLGHIRFLQERWDDAAAHFERSLELEPNYQAQYNLAVTHTRRGALQKARETYLELLETHPHHISSLLNLGRIYRDEDKYMQALACYRLVKRLDPGNQQARTGIAIALLATADDPMPAIAELINLLDEDASNTDAREALNRAIHGTGQ